MIETFACHGVLMNVGGSARLLIGRRSFSSRTRLFFERVYERGGVR